MAKRLVIAGTGSGVGKTTITIGIMAALKKRGLIVQGFKCGPDYIDPTYHTAVTNRTSRNIDSVMFSKNVLLDIVERNSRDVDISIIEGVMGFFDGQDPLKNTGSAADISDITNSPVLLIVNCASMARSAAAIVKGFQALHEPSNIKGVIANQVGSKGHFQIVKAAIEQECGIPVIGYMTRNNALHLPSRNLGLIPAIERGELTSYFELLAEEIEKTIDLDQLLHIAQCEPIAPVNDSIFDEKSTKQVTIAVAKDVAFNFYYEENLQLLRANGAKLHYFSPLANEEVPEHADGLYLGGGFPEEFAKTLSENDRTKQSIKRAIERGVPTVAECGGFIYLTNSLKTVDETVYPMIGVIDGEIAMQEKLAALGYREVVGVRGNFLLDDGEVAKGHEFHYSKYDGVNEPYAFEVKSRFGEKNEGFLLDSLVASFVHLHFASNPKAVNNWIDTCKLYQKKKRS